MAVRNRCPDWVISNNSNVHVARDRSWFTAYISYNTHLKSTYFENAKPIPVAGIGTVELSFVKDYSLSGVEIHDSIILENVLHAPGAICNILGYPFLAAFSWDIRGQRLLDSNSQVAALLDRRGRGLMTLKLSGGQAGASVLEDDGGHLVSVYWPAEEIARCYEFQRRVQPKPKAKLSNEQRRVPPYAQKEKRWLKMHYKSEFYFLRQHRLQIYRERDRAKGRKIARALIKAEQRQEGE